MNAEIILAAAHVIAKIEDKAYEAGVSLLSALSEARAEYILEMSRPNPKYLEIKKEVIASLDRMISYEISKMPVVEISDDMSYEDQMNALFGSIV